MKQLAKYGTESDGTITSRCGATTVVTLKYWCHTAYDKGQIVCNYTMRNKT